jgi:hypothetical protein
MDYVSGKNISSLRTEGLDGAVMAVSGRLGLCVGGRISRLYVSTWRVIKSMMAETYHNPLHANWTAKFH